MDEKNTPVSRATDVDPLVPLDVIRPPQQRGTDDVQLDVIPPLEPEEMAEAEIDEHAHDKAVTPDQAPKYKGDVNAPVDAEHPLANAPDSEADGRLKPENPRD